MAIARKQKERETVPVPPNSRTNCSLHGSYKYTLFRSFLHKAPSFLLSLILSLSFALLCFLSYGWLTLIYFFKLLLTKEVEESGNGDQGVVKVCVSQKAATEEVNSDCTGSYLELSNGEIEEEEEILEVDKMVEAPIEEEGLLDDENTEDLLNSKEYRTVSLTRPPDPWSSFCGIVEVFFQKKGYD